MSKVATVFNGTYTIQSPNGGHKTIDISTQPKNAKFAPGERIASKLVGPDNTSSYKGFGFVSNRGINVYKKLRGPKDRPTEWQWLAHVLWDMATKGTQSRWYAKGYRLLTEGACIVCNRKLTTPESILTGIGPVCAGRTGKHDRGPARRINRIDDVDDEGDAERRAEAAGELEAFTRRIG